MNERITELAIEAGIYTNKSEMLHKFAELIVKECVLGIQMTMVRDGYDTKHYLQSMKHINYIRKHFGIE